VHNQESSENNLIKEKLKKKIKQKMHDSKAALKFK
jgi:hypothetical protein